MSWRLAVSYFIHALTDWAPAVTNMTRHVGKSNAWASASGIRLPSASLSATLIGTVWPRFHFAFVDGERKPRIRYSTTYRTVTVVVLPALSLAAQVSVCMPALLVSS